MMLYELAKIFWVAFLGAAVGAYPIYRTLLAMKSRQTVSQYAPEGHQKKQGTPTMGGIIIVFGLLVAGLAMSTVRFEDAAAHVPSGPIVGGMVLLALFGAIGFIDDFVVPRLMKGKRGLGWKQKILMQLVAAFAGLYATSSTMSVAEYGLGIFLVLFLSNAYNFSDGLDALAGTLLLGLCFGIFGVACTLGSGVTIALWTVALAGAVMPFLFLNAPPAKIFMGDVGSLPIGALIGLLFHLILSSSTDARWMRAWSEEPTLNAFGVPVSSAPVALTVWCLVLVGTMMIVELVPPPLQVAAVKILKRRIFPYTPIHHAFEKAGWPETRVVAMFALAQAVLSAVAIFLASTWLRVNHS
jgi:phospho-N-acetylmuramoyl-pentapeptide-transferase